MFQSNHPSLAVFLTFSAALLASALPAWAEFPSGRPALDQQERLAVCRVQSLSTKAAPTEMAAVCARMVRRPVANNNLLANYTRTQDGLWPIAKQVDVEDPWLRVLLIGPTKPLVIDIAVLVNGRPYRSVREQWIDQRLEQAQAGPPDPPEESDSTETASFDTSSPLTDNEVTDETEGAEKAEELPTVKTRTRQAPTVGQRLINYLSANDAQANREELRWLLAEWTGGPGLLALAPAFTWQRATVAPLWNYLDGNGDRSLSSVEIREASARLELADVDENDVVDLEEMLHTSTNRLPYSLARSHPLLVVLNENTNWEALRRILVEKYGQSDDGLLQKPPDIALRVALGKDGEQLSLLAVSDAVSESAQPVSASDQVITVDLGGAYLELSAAQRKDNVSKDKTNDDARQTQIAVGAVVDGYPLFRILDRDNDRRLTLRERRQLDSCLAALDTNGDRQIDQNEIPTAIRLAVTLGPYVHEHLQLPTAATREVNSPDRPSAPSWFLSMDRNGDGDLSRSEFLGVTKQFNQFDADGDGLIGVGEVQQLSKE